MITLRQLRYLQALARYRHFGRAAEACAVTQPALSMQIRELEKELDVELIDRRPGDAALTEIGVLVAKRGDEVLAAARDLVDFARHQGRLFEGELKLGVIPTLAPYLLPKLLPLLQARHPDLVVKLRETQTKALVEELVAGDLDAVMLSMPAPEADIEVIRLFDDPFLLAVPADDARPEIARVSDGRSRPQPLDSAGTRPLPARPGARFLRAREVRHAAEPRRRQPGDHHANGRQRLRRHALT